jgi:hypothetical protein
MDKWNPATFWDNKQYNQDQTDQSGDDIERYRYIYIMYTLKL